MHSCHCIRQRAVSRKCVCIYVCMYEKEREGKRWNEKEREESCMENNLDGHQHQRERPIGRTLASHWSVDCEILCGYSHMLLLPQESIMLLVFRAKIWYKIFYILFTPAIQFSFDFSFLPILHLSIFKCDKGVSKNERIYSFNNEIKNLPITNSLHKIPQT